MVTVYNIKMNFRAEDMKFARELYGHWQNFCKRDVEDVMDQIFTDYDSEDEVIQVGTLEVDLGKIVEEEFYESFPKILRDKLQESFHNLLRHTETHNVNIISLDKNGLEVLLYFLLSGRFPEMVPDDYRNPGKLLEIVLSKSGYELGKLLRHYGEKPELRRRLVRQFKDYTLEKVVDITHSSEALFIKIYTRSLIVSWVRLRHPEIAFRDYRDVIWEVVWAYLLCREHNFFSRKEFIRQTIKELALHFNLKFQYLLKLLTTGLKKMISGWLVMPGLVLILAEIRREEGEKVQEKNLDGQNLLKEKTGLQEIEGLRRLLSRPEACRRLLQPLSEEDIYRLVSIILPAESPFIVSYARKLDQDQQKGMLEGRAGQEFRLLKWEFLFLVLLEAPETTFQRKQFVSGVLCRIAAWYNVDPRTLLDYLCSDKKWIPMELQQVLLELYREQFGERIINVVKALSYRELREGETEHLKYILLHPEKCRRLLSAVSEKEIYRLTRALLPAESPFVISYARTLDREKEKGMLEGKGGTEFRLLKWEFIFIVMWGTQGAVFQRRQFVRLVLERLAAHYNLEMISLTRYFYRALGERETDFTGSIRKVLREWLQEWKDEVTEQGISVEEREKNSKQEWFVLPEITLEKLNTAGIREVEKLLLGFQQEKIAVFLRKNRKVLWDFVTSSPGHMRRLYRLMQVVENMAEFLIGIWGRKLMVQALHSAGIFLPDSDKLMVTVWQEALIRKDIKMIKQLLEFSPKFLQCRMKTVSSEEKKKLEELLEEHPEILRKWLQCLGSSALQQAVWNVIRLHEKGGLGVPLGKLLAGLLRFTYGEVPHYSETEILSAYWNQIADSLTPVQKTGICRSVEKYSRYLSSWERIIEENLKMKETVEIVRRERSNRVNKQSKIKAMDVHNAGIVILAPYFPRLFDLLKFIDKGIFTGEPNRIRAMFAVQYLTFGQTEFPETEFGLNKLLVEYNSETPLPFSVEFTQEEKDILDSLLKGAIRNWEKIKHISLEGFRGSFLIRNGVITETEDAWQLTVEEKSYDMLLDSLPWNVSPVKLPWMKKLLYVNWR